MIMQKKWWHEKVAYQIYPKSFYDSNGDGIGDLRGIIQKLPYLHELGVDIVWISPCYCSPLADEGYDISDYYNIDPRFGTMDDMDELIAKAKKYDIGIVMDLVVNHCSDEHEWFRKACEDPDGEYGKFFYIEDMKDGKVPCNWRSHFGGSVWEPLPGHPDKCYMHLFHKKQPDLNWENPKLREELYKMINWWLDKGIAGFRLDAIINIKKALPYKDYPVDRPDGMSKAQNMIADAVGLGDFLREMRDRCFRVYDAFTVGEVFDEDPSELVNFIGDDGYFSSMYDFSSNVWGQSDKGWYDCRPITPNAYRDCIFAAQKRSEGVGFYSNIIENHDEPRGVSRYIPEGDVNDTSKKALATVMFMLKGLPFIYQGQEIGMENMKFRSIDEVDDISTIDQYQVSLDAGLSEGEALKSISLFSRDNARTPFQWNAEANAGFTTGTPWLRVNPNYADINLESQRNDPDSVFQFYRKLIALRKDPQYKDVIVYGVTTPFQSERDNLIAFTRKTDVQTLLVAVNFQNEPQTVKLDAPYKKVLLNNLSELDGAGAELTLGGYQAVVLEL